MPVRKFYAATLNEALKAVKGAFGDQAVIVSTRELEPGEWRPMAAGARAMEVIASDDPAHAAPRRPRVVAPRQPPEPLAIEAQAEELPVESPPAEKAPFEMAPMPVAASGAGAAPEPLPAPMPVPLAAESGRAPPAPSEAFSAARLRQEIQDIHSALRRLMAGVDSPGPHQLAPLGLRLYRHLCAQGVNPVFAQAMIEGICQAASSEQTRDAQWFEEAVRREMAPHVPVAPVRDLGPTVERGLALVGVSGVGKSTSVAKIASLFALEMGIPVRIGVLEPAGYPPSEILRIAGELLGVPVETLRRIDEIPQYLAREVGGAKVLLDLNLAEPWTTGPDRETVSMLTRCPNLDIHMVLSGGTKLENLSVLVRNSQMAPATALGFTKLDETATFGSIFEMVRTSRLPISFFSAGRRIPEDLIAAQADELVGRTVSGWREFNA
jgi:flagellar biosynthesis protein FlhF